MQQHVLTTVKSFKYLGSIISGEGGCKEDVQKRISTGWIKWRGLTSVLCDRRMPKKMKGKIYKTVIRPAMLYGSECWPVKKDDERALEVTEMKMLRWSVGVTRKDRIRNETIRASLGVRNIAEKIQGRRLQWYGHIMRRPEDYVGNVANKIKAPTKKKRGQHKKWAHCVKNDLKELQLAVEDTADRCKWKKLTCMADPALLRE